jgi:ABC-type lipopolysaccharide export system ATPase subunit
MKKIDLHIHTVPTQSDSDFTFELTKLVEYVAKAQLDAIAITNHNIFDLHQFKTIRQSLTIPAFPGIEINLDNGHLLLNGDTNELDDFDSKCSEVTKKVKSPTDSISREELVGVYQNLSRYLLIPHYEKNPYLSEETIAYLSDFIVAGEVDSPKKFIYCIKNADRLVPVYFSDCRISTELVSLPVRQTFIACGGITLGAIRNCLRDKHKVSLSANTGNTLFRAFDDGQELSTGLNVIVGERSTGKSYTLNRLSQAFENVKYIRQFSLVERDEQKDEEKFNRLLSQQHSLLTHDYLKEFQKVVTDLINMDLSQNSRSVSEYLESLKTHAKESERKDAFSKAVLFSQEAFQVANLKGLTDLIKSVQNIIENVEFRVIIEKYVDIQSLKALIVELMQEYGKRREIQLKQEWLNDLIYEIKSRLQMRTASTVIKEVDLYKVALDDKRAERFRDIVRLVKKDREIVRRTVQGFTVVAKVGPFTRVGELKKLSKSKNAFRSAFDEYENSYSFLQELKKIDGLEESEYYKLFAKIEYQILNRDGYEISGGERSEFNLLQEINDARKHDMLLIDEPESSFDNLFLRKEVNEIIKDISKQMPVVLVTHNNTVGASIRPEYILYTKKEYIDRTIQYRVFSGFPTDKELVSRDGKRIRNLDAILDCLEAGKKAYHERRRSYEDIKD